MNLQNTKVYLINTPLNNKYEHTLYFGNKEAQRLYFTGQAVRTYENFTYQRKDNIIRVPDKADTLIDKGVNYVMYKNSDYSDKWYYAFVKEIRYIDDGRSDLVIETDVLQTWLEEINVGQCMVEREHVKDDTIGLHTFPEQLEHGEYVCYGVSEDEKLKDYCYVMLVTEWTTSDSDPETLDKPLATNFGGVPSAGGAYICNTITEIVTIVKYFDDKGKGDTITALYMIPKSMINNTSGAMQYSGQAEPSSHEHSIMKPVSFNNFHPKNNKVLCFPYNYLLVSNNSGSANVYQYELFKSNPEEDNGTTLSFQVKGIPSIGGSIKCIPMNYKGIMYNEEEGLVGGKYPTLSWSQDLYTNWLTQNGVNNVLSIGVGALKIVGGAIMMVASGGSAGVVGGGTMVSGVNDITKTLTQIYEHSFQPNSARGNVNAGDINTASKNNTFFFYKMGIKEEYARILDDYFTMYGYKIARCKTPNYNHRMNFWFTKTIEANITGAIPQDDLNKIKECYNTGITFWKNPSNFRKYDVDNSII